MAPQKSAFLAAIATAIALLVVPAMSLSGGIQATMLISVAVRPSASFKVQNAAEVAPSSYTLAPGGYTTTMDAAPVLVLNTAPVKPEVIIEVLADAAGPAASKELAMELSGQQTADGGKLVSLRDLGVAAAPASGRFEGTNLKEVFERAAGEITYRLDLLKDIKGARETPILININL
jgi:hypothetical protein